MDNELEDFKKLDLIAYAIHRGYSIDNQKTSRHCTVMGNGSFKLGISKGDDDKWYVFNYTLDKGGTIIDFAQDFSHNKSIGEVRKEIRQYAHLEKPIQQQHTYLKPQPAKKNRIDVLSEFNAAILLHRSLFLNSRGIKNETLKNERFYGNIFTDKYANVCFPNWDEKGFSGFEKRNKNNFKSFSTGGDRGIWFSKAKKTDKSIAIFESGIDALSYFQLKDDGHTQYVSIGGQLGKTQSRLINKIVEKNQDKIIKLCFDNDEPGLKYITSILETNKQSKNFQIDIPNEKGQDWNDILKQGLICNQVLSLSR